MDIMHQILHKRMAEIGEEGVFVLISDSTEAEKPVDIILRKM